MKLKRSILIEGPDGSGKSTLFNRMTGVTNGWDLPSAGHDGGPLKSEVEAWKRLADFAARGPAVRDRCPAVSELVYSRALGREPVADLEELLEWLELYDPLVVMCRPPTHVILSQPVQERAYKDNALVMDIMEMRTDVLSGYDALMIEMVRRKNLDLYIYDWTLDPEGNQLYSVLVGEGVICVD